MIVRVEHLGGADEMTTDGTFDFDGGSLLVWKDHTKQELVAAYSPATAWVLIPGGVKNGR